MRQPTWSVSLNQARNGVDHQWRVGEPCPWWWTLAPAFSVETGARSWQWAAQLCRGHPDK
jgi:hypothetical protein